MVDVAAAVLLRPDGSFLLGCRAADTFYPGYWEFPGGKVEPGETPRQALLRELEEELGIRVDTAWPWLVREHHYEHAHVRLHFFRVTAWTGALQDHVHAGLSWQLPGATTVAPMLPANASILKALTLPARYAITQAATVGVDRQMGALHAALSRGERLIQIREPDMGIAARESFAHQATVACHAQGARVLVNADVDLARRVGADGVHLQARQLRVQPERPDMPLVAASCHDAGELALAARLGVDFVVLGPVGVTATHPDRVPLGWERFATLIAGYGLPVYALGGMTPPDLDIARALGAQGIAAIRTAWD